MKKRMALAAMVLGGTMMMTACAAGTSGGTAKMENGQSKVVNVRSSETVTAEPDMAEVELTVYSQATDPKTCQTQNSADLQKVVDSLKSQGINEGSIQTASFGLNPIYDWEGGKTITGYEMETQVTVRDIPIETVGVVLETSVESGANQIDSLTYLCSTFDDKYQEALKMAVESAKVKAQAMAEAGGCTLGSVVNLEELSSSQEARYSKMNHMSQEYSADTASLEAGMDVMGGELEIEASVSVDFEIK